MRSDVCLSVSWTHTLGRCTEHANHYYNMFALVSPRFFQDIYLLRHDGPVTDLKFEPGEVEDVKLVPMDQLKKAYESQVRLRSSRRSSEALSAPLGMRAVLFWCCAVNYY